MQIMVPLAHNSVISLNVTGLLYIKPWSYFFTVFFSISPLQPSQKSQVSFVHGVSFFPAFLVIISSMLVLYF